jgi:hypothetical protein
MSLGYPCCGSLITDVHAPGCRYANGGARSLPDISPGEPLKSLLKLLPREQDAIDGLKYCLRHQRPPFLMDIRILLRIVDRATSDKL